MSIRNTTKIRQSEHTLVSGETLAVDLSNVDWYAYPGWTLKTGAGCTVSVSGSNRSIPTTADWLEHSSDADVRPDQEATVAEEGIVSWLRFVVNGGEASFALAYLGNLVVHSSVADTLSANSDLDLSLNSSGDSITLKSSTLFDYSKGSLRLSAISGDTAILTAENISADSLLLTPVNSGDVTVSVTATTVTGLSVVATFNVSVS